jgi:general secretion pathway protein L
MQGISQFLNWWLSQLGSLLPSAFVGRSSSFSDAVIVERDRTHLNLLVRRRGRAQKLVQQTEGDADVQTLQRTLRSHSGLPRNLVIRLPSAQLLRKALVMPVAAKRNLADVLGFEIDRETPFRRDEVHWTYVVRGQDTRAGRLDVELILLPRSFVDPLVETLRAAALEPVGIEAQADSGIATVIPLGSHKHGQWLDGQRSLMPLGAAASILAVLAVAVPFVVQQLDLAAVEARISELEPAAKEAGSFRQDAAQIAAAMAFLATERDKNGSPLTALAATTRALPDDSYLSALSLRNGRLTLNGKSPSAAQLIGELAQSPDFREPSFEAPVTRDPDTALESFAISVALVSKAEP